MTHPSKISNPMYEALGELWSTSRILDDVTYLCDEFGNRFAGSESERRARDHIAAKFKEYGLENVTIEPCRYTGWKRGTCEAELLEPRRRMLKAISMVHAAPTPKEGLEGEIVSVGQGTPAEFKRLGDKVRGKIAMMTLGSPAGAPPADRRPSDRFRVGVRSIPLVVRHLRPARR